MANVIGAVQTTMRANAAHVTARLREINKTAKLVAREDVFKTALVDAAAERAPVASGRLRGDIRAMKTGKIVAGRAKLRYAAAVHWGIKRPRYRVGLRPPNTFVLDAFDDDAEVARAADRALQDIIDRA